MSGALRLSASRTPGSCARAATQLGAPSQFNRDKAFNQFMLQKDRDEEDKTNDRELVHGFAGAPHIDANDIASFNTGIAGPGDYMLNTKGLLEASMSNANTFVLASGNLLMQGRHVTFVSSISATVVSGAQGVKRKRPCRLPVLKSVQRCRDGGADDPPGSRHAGNTSRPPYIRRAA